MACFGVHLVLLPGWDTGQGRNRILDSHPYQEIS